MVTYASDPEYADRWVAFLDIQGFSALTRRAHDDVAFRAFLRDCITTLKGTLPSRNERTNFRYVQFSDSIVISAKMDREGLFAVMHGANMLINNMMGRGILLRGGIAGGNLHHDEHMMFGPALLDAYEFEKRGGPPHISLDEKVVRALDSGLWDDDAHQWECLDPWDLSPMLHTLRQFGDYTGEVVEGGAVLDEHAVHLAAMFQARAWDRDALPNIRAKWRWMQDYWNRTVEPNGILPCSADRSPREWQDLVEQTRAAVIARVEKHNREKSEQGG